MRLSAGILIGASLLVACQHPDPYGLARPPTEVALAQQSPVGGEAGQAERRLRINACEVQFGVMPTDFDVPLSERPRERLPEGVTMDDLMRCVMGIE